jgi:penicillin amidase
VDPNDPGRYLFRSQSLPFETRVETIHVAGAADVTFTVRSTGHGPVVNDADERLRDSGMLYALRWAATTQTEHTIDAVYRVNVASTFDEFRAALSLWGSPSQNFVYADVDGHIGYQLPGNIPVRQDGGGGDRPVPGWDGQHEWIGQIPFEDLPYLYDPPSGLIVTANNAVVDANWPDFIARDWDPGYRAARVLAVLQSAAGTGITLDQASALQNDTLVPRAALVVPHLADAAPATKDGRALLQEIQQWDGRCGIDSVGCSAYMTFEYRLERAIFDARLGPDLARMYVGTTASWQALIGLLGRPDDPWWDDPETAATESAAITVSIALDEAGADLRTALGEPDRWTWGRLHTATFREATLGSSGIGPLEWYFNAGPYPVPGAAGAIDNTFYRLGRAYPDPADPTFQPVGLKGLFEVTNLPSYRLVVDMGDLDSGRFIQTTGNGGNPFDRHYGDLIQRWVNGALVPLWFSRTAVEAHAASTLTLTP